MTKILLEEEEGLARESVCNVKLSPDSSVNYDGTVEEYIQYGKKSCT